MEDLLSFGSAWARAGVLLWWGLVLAACPGESASPPGEPERDVGPGDGAVDGAPEISVDPPALPVMTPCPVGWAEVARFGFPTCEPYPRGRQQCGPGEAHFPGGLGCEPVGDPCPVGGFPDPTSLPSDRQVIYVSASSTGGDGSRDRPLTNLSAGVEAASGGGLVVLGPGTYPAGLRLSESLEIRGACARDVRLVPAVPDSAAMVARGVMQLTLRNLTLGPEPEGLALSAWDGVSVRMEGVVVTGIEAPRVATAFEGHDVALRSLTGIVLNLGGDYTLRRAVIEEAPSIARNSPGAVNLEQVAVVNSGRLTVLPEAVGPLRATATVFERSRCLAMAAFGGSGELALEDLIVRDTQACGRGPDEVGRGINVYGGMSLRGSRLQIEGSGVVGVAVGDASHAELTDLVITDTRSEAQSGTAGIGLAAHRGGQVEVSRALLARNSEVAMAAVGRGVSVRGGDITIADTRGRAWDGKAGRGLDVANSATADLRRVYLVRNRELSVLAAHRGKVALHDLRVSDSLERACAETSCRPAPFGSAVGAVAGGEVELERFALERGHQCGIQLAGGWASARAGRVSGFDIGVCLDNPDVELRDLEQGVHYDSNRADLRTIALPVPDAVTSLEAIDPG